MLGCEGLRPHYSMTKFTIYNYTLTFFAHNYFPFPFISWSMSLHYIHEAQHTCSGQTILSSLSPRILCSFKIVFKGLSNECPQQKCFDFFRRYFQQFIEIWAFSFLVMSSSILSIAFLSYLSISSTLFLFTTLLLAFLFQNDHRWPLLTL